MLICIDIGNTNIVMGLMENDVLLNSIRLETKKHTTEDEYGIKILDSLKYLNISQKDIKGVIIASVVPEVDSTFKKVFNKYFNLEPLFVMQGVKTGIKIKLDNPRQLGADLLVGSVAATEKYGYPCAVIDMGTATTITVVNKNKELIGGIIYPGVFTSFDSLIKATSLLESARFEKPKNIIGNDTLSCLQSGMYYGTLSTLSGLIEKLKEEIENIKIILTGGIASFFMEDLKNTIYDKNLLLDGLNIIYKKNKLL